ncbi:MAG: SpoIID/LytB domain-containing protein [Actinomycetota bacterium]|nr:SpoIID/LytB domain-containing protein [Actinomycetota bacterium]
MRIKAAIFCFVLLGTLMVPGVAQAERTVTITGGGWGHGIGMSQYGAYGRAKNGRSASEILQHYYTGVALDERKMPSIRVGLLQTRNSISLTTSAFNGGSGKIEFKVKGSSETLAEGGPGVSWRTEPSQAGGIRLFKDGEQVRREGTGVFGSSKNPLILRYEPFGTLVDVADKSYNYVHGRMEIGTYSTNDCNAGFCLRLVVKLSMQKYLYGLAEVPSSWPSAVLEAQAITGRTYAYDKAKRSGHHRYPCDCTVFDSTFDQAYAGDGKRSGSGVYWEDWKGAVDNTKGRIVTHNGSPAQTLYSSSSGGHTENNENVWGGTPLPYLRGVKDATDSVSANPNHKWDPVTMRFREFQSRLSEYGTGRIERVSVVAPRGVSGRVTVVKSDSKGGIRIVGEKKTVHVSGWDFRTKFGSDVLLDTLFYLDVQYAVGDRFAPAYRKLDRAPGDATSSVYKVPRHASNVLGRAQDFEKGRMTWRKETDKVVWQWGEVLKKYDRVGRERSKLGMPTSGIWGEAARYRGANYVNGVIFWSSETGAHHIRNAFHASFTDAGGRKRLGLPTTDVFDTQRNGRQQRFVTGTLYQPPKMTAVYALWGPIDERYRALGMGTSRCGFPRSSMVADSAGAAAVFQNGSITYSDEVGVRVHCT